MIINHYVPVPAVVLQTRGLTHVYSVGHGAITALCEVDLQVSRGEFVAVIGARRSGKSTLLNLMGALDTPTSGSVRLGSKILSALSEPTRADLRRQTFGFIFQGGDLFPELTTLENVMYPLLVAGIPLLERVARAQTLLAKVGLADQAQTFPDDLSVGDQMRVAIARALISKPSILLADEPTGDLDSRTANEIMTLLVDLVKAAHLTLVMVTQDLSAARCADRTLYLHNGHLLTAQDVAYQVLNVNLVEAQGS